MRKLVYLLFSVAILSACQDDYSNLKDGLYADIDTDKGNIIVELYPEEAPLTVANFVTLAEGTNPNVVDSLAGKPYYNELGFHRVVKDFVVQGGDPLGTGQGGPGYRFTSEFSKKLSHNRPGILSMANSGGMNTNGSQFFITHKATQWLDGYDRNGNLKNCYEAGVSCHSIFGSVKIGQQVVDSLAQYDMIKTIKIIRKGTKAESFDAVKVFTDLFVDGEELDKKYQIEYQKKIEAFYESMNIKDAKQTESGLKILTLAKGKGKKFNRTLNATVHYSMYINSGRLVQSTKDRGPFSFVYEDTPMIPGVTEAIDKMREGGKVRLFIPSYLGYGRQGNSAIPPNSDLVFELELLKVGQ